MIGLHLSQLTFDTLYKMAFWFLGILAGARLGAFVLVCPTSFQDHDSVDDWPKVRRSSFGGLRIHGELLAQG